MGLENYYIISDHFTHTTCLGSGTFSHSQSWVLGAESWGISAAPCTPVMDRSWVYVPQLPPLGERISGNSIPRELHSSCPWAVLLPILLPHILTRVTYCDLLFSFPARLSLGQKRETSGNSAVVVVAGYMISIIFCLESRVSKIGKAMNSRPDHSSGAQCGSNSKLFNEASA